MAICYSHNIRDALGVLPTLPQGKWAGFVYLGWFVPSSETLFVKVGQTTNLFSRIDQFSTHLPGGLTFMSAAPVDRHAYLLFKEADVMDAIADISGAEAISGEWYKLPIESVQCAIEALRSAGEPHIVPLKNLLPRRARPSDKTFMRRAEAESMERNAREQRRISKSNTGHCGSYGGTLRG